MSLNDILGSAISGLTAAQAGLRTVSTNIANVGTPGYARERLSLSTQVTAGRVTGVTLGEPSRVADRFLEGAVYRRGGEIGRAEVTSSYLDRLQSLLGAPGASSGLSARLDAVATSAIAMTGGQASAQTIARFTTNVQDAIGSMNQLSGDVDRLRSDVESEVGYSVDKVNGLLKSIYELNESVARLSGLGRSVAGVADRRMAAIEELSSLLQINVRDQPDGRVTIDTASGAALLDRRLRQLSYPVTGAGASQPVYPPVEIRFADADGNVGAATGEKIDSAAVGGKLGGLLDLRDHLLPEFSDRLGTLFGGLAETLNAVSNEGTSVPAPRVLEGRPTPLVGADRFGFEGAAIFAVTKADGELVAKARIDFSALGSAATVDDALAAINAGLGGHGSATMVDGKLVVQATAAGNGIAIAQDPTSPSARAGVGFSQYFGLNDVVQSSSSGLVPWGFTAGDPHGFSAGQSADMVLRDSSGRTLASYTLTGSVGPTFGDLVTELNASSLGGFGSFSLDDRGRIRFEADPSAAGSSLSIPTDSTDRLGTGRSFSSMSGLSGASSGLSHADVRPDIVANPLRLPLARVQTDAAVGQKAIGPTDIRGATALVDRLAAAVDFGKEGVVTIERFSALLLGRAGMQASQARDALTDATARRDDAVNRRDSFAGVNIDEELAQMVVLQNSYSASARVMSTAREMYDALIAIAG